MGHNPTRVVSFFISNLIIAPICKTEQDAVPRPERDAVPRPERDAVLCLERGGALESENEGDYCDADYFIRESDCACKMNMRKCDVTIDITT